MKIPKRKKSNDNPYTIIYKGDDKNYKIQFKDSKKNDVIIDISKELYLAFDSFELEDISQMHKYDKYIEHSEINEESLYKRMNKTFISVEEEVEKNIENEQLIYFVNLLPNVQKRRIYMYFFEGLTMENIAKIENCSFQAVSKSIMNGLENLKKNYKNK